jgi:outer membrane biosynthesis protein TonB
MLIAIAKSRPAHGSASKHQGDRMMKARSVTLAMASAFVLNAGLAIAEEPATTPPAKPETSTQAQKPATPKEETTSPKPAEKGTDKPNEEPNCE